MAPKPPATPAETAAKLPFDFDRAIARVPRWIGVLGLVGTGASGQMGGMHWAGPFAVGAVASYFNFRLIERFTSSLGAGPRKAGGYVLFIQFTLFALGAFVIIRTSGFSVGAAFLGFLVCPAAAIAELVYELLTYGHS